MTGIGQQAPPPGWYPDPDGAPGWVRWWSGAEWSDVATPSGPGVAVGHSPVLAPAQPRPDPDPWPEPPPRRNGRRTAWLVALSVLGVVVAVVAGLLVAGTGTRTTGTAASASSDPLPPAPAPAVPPGSVRIVDEAAGISYPFLGSGWSEWDRGAQVETTETSGQYFVTQEELPDGFDVFIAQCTSGPLVAAFGWSGPASLQTTTATVADFVRQAHYPSPNDREVRRDEAVTVDGAAGWVVEFDLTWDVEGYDATGERAALLLVDVGRPAPALLYLSIPNTHAELYGAIDRVISAVEVL